jgi:hypothetical protein
MAILLLFSLLLLLVKFKIMRAAIYTKNPTQNAIIKYPVITGKIRLKNEVSKSCFQWKFFMALCHI